MPNPHRGSFYNRRDLDMSEGIIGKRFGRLVVEAEDKSAKRKSFWCICDCGAKISVRRDSLVGNLTRCVKNGVTIT